MDGFKEMAKMRIHFRRVHLKLNKKTTKLHPSFRMNSCKACSWGKGEDRDSRGLQRHYMGKTHTVEELLEKGVEMWVLF